MKKIGIAVYKHYYESFIALEKIIFEKNVNVEMIYIFDNNIEISIYNYIVEVSKKYENFITLGKVNVNLTENEKIDYAVRLASTEIVFPYFPKIDINSLYKSHYYNKTDADSNKCFKPLVTITIHNWNYGEYLNDCIESVLNQTYAEIQIVISDNNSSDESWSIIEKHLRQNPSKISVVKNRNNFGSSKNVKQCETLTRGVYNLQLCADDILDKNCVEKCINLFSKKPDIGLIIFNRKILIQETNQLITEAPFYNDSYIIEGAQQQSVFMMASINPSISQVMYNRKFSEFKLPKTLVDLWFVNRVKDFLICGSASLGYLKDALVTHRIHGSNDMNSANENLLEIIGPYILNNTFKIMAIDNDHVSNKYKESLSKLSTLALRYAVKNLSNIVLSKKYHSLSYIVDHEIINHDVFIMLNDYYCSRITYDHLNAKINKIEEYRMVRQLVRTKSYPPPPNSTKIAI